MKTPSQLSKKDLLDRMVRAVELVRQRLRRTTQALEGAEIDHAIVCGNAVAAWVATVDESAVRNTPDVEVLLRPADVPAAINALEAADFQHRTEEGKHWFEDRRRNIPHRHTVRIYFPADAGLTDWTSALSTTPGRRGSKRNWPTACNNFSTIPRGDGKQASCEAASGRLAEHHN
jgi:hypothetical protein